MFGNIVYKITEANNNKLIPFRTDWTPILSNIVAPNDIGGKLMPIFWHLQQPSKFNIYKTVNLCRILNDLPSNVYLTIINDCYKQYINKIIDANLISSHHYYKHAWFIDGEDNNKIVINLTFFLEKCDKDIVNILNNRFNAMPYIETAPFHSSYQELCNYTLGRKPNGERVTLWYGYFAAFSIATGLNMTNIQRRISGDEYRNLRNPSSTASRLNSQTHGKPVRTYQMYLKRIFLDLINHRKVV